MTDVAPQTPLDELPTCDRCDGAMVEDVELHNAWHTDRDAGVPSPVMCRVCETMQPDLVAHVAAEHPHEIFPGADT
ncbi:MAG: hypothetical protein LC798_03055 [Chloroflexi bacterium]|nr:hypothetical protein [Chloroflexota bacterium]